VLVSLLTPVLAVLLAPTASADDPLPGPWRSYGPGLGGDTALVVLHERDPLQAYALVDAFGASDRYIYRTIDGGETWWPLALAGFRPFDIAFEPDNHLVGYASSSTAVYRTLDGGESWETVPDLPPLRVNALAIDPDVPSTVYAGGEGGLYKSIDRGDSWGLLSSGLPSTAQGRKLAISPSEPATVYYSAFDSGSQTTRVFRSTNAGATWSQVLSSPQTVTTLAVAPTDPSTVYVGASQRGLLASLDGGATWADRPSPSTRPWTLAFSPASADTLYLGAVEGGFRSTDGGATWSGLGNLPAGGQVRSLAVSEADPTRVLAGTCCYLGGVYRSLNGGESWQAASAGLAGDSNIWSVAVDPSDPGVVFAGISGGTDLSVFRGSDNGERWRPSSGGIPPRSWIKAVAVDPSDPDSVFAAGPIGLYGSGDGGTSWTKVALPQPSTAGAIAFAPSNPRIVYVGGAYNALAQGTFGAAVFKSTDGGGAWTNVSRGLLPTGEVSDIEVDPTNPDVVYAAVGNHGIFKSTDGGITWVNHRVGIRSTGMLALAIDPVDPSIVYAGGTGTTVTAGTGLYKSVNGGVIWAPTALTGASVSSIAIDPTDPQRLFATQYLAGARVMTSPDGGASWTPMIEGLDGDPIIPNLTIDPSGRRLYAASGGHGVYVAELG
jgi:photosystem II stability/assembly factor-like uncharacterized protein